MPWSDLSAFLFDGLRSWDWEHGYLSKAFDLEFNFFPFGMYFFSLR